MNNTINPKTISRYLITVIASILIVLSGFSSIASAQITDPHIPRVYMRVEATGTVQRITITQFNGRGRFHAAVVVEGVSYIGFGRYDASSDTFSVKWYSFDTPGIAMLRGSFTGSLSANDKVLIGSDSGSLFRYRFTGA